jgi:hypothetical protein
VNSGVASPSIKNALLPALWRELLAVLPATPIGHASQRRGEYWGEFVMVVVHSCGGLGGVWPSDAPYVLDESVLERDWGGEKQRVQGRAVESGPKLTGCRPAPNKGLDR